MLKIGQIYYTGHHLCLPLLTNGRNMSANLGKVGDLGLPVSMTKIITKIKWDVRLCTV